MSLGMAVDPIFTPIGTSTELATSWVKIPCVNLAAWFLIPLAFFVVYTLDVCCVLIYHPPLHVLRLKWPTFPRGRPGFYQLRVLEETPTALRFAYWVAGVIPASLMIVLPIMSLCKRYWCAYAVCDQSRTFS